MAQTYFAILTAVGEAKIANAHALGTTVEITDMAVGDGNGAPTVPNTAQTALVKENRRAPLNTLMVDPLNANQIIAEQVIPENVGGWFIREIGLFDDDGDLIAVANCPDTYKPLLSEGSGRTQVIRMVLVVSSTAAVQLRIDPSVVLATRGYVDAQILTVMSNIPSQAEAEAGTNNTKFMTALRVAQAIAARVVAATESVAGLVEKATAAEAQAFAEDKFIDGARLASAFLGANQSLTSTGYQKLPGGLIVQWGTASAVAASATAEVTFPIAFPTTMLTAQVSGNTSTPGPISFVSGPSGARFGLTLYNSAGATRGVFWLALGC